MHVIDLARLTYPWLESFAPLKRDYPVTVWEAEARRCGITAALHMEVDVAEPDIETETAMVEEFMARPNSLVVGAISSCRPESKGFLPFPSVQQVHQREKYTISRNTSQSVAHRKVYSVATMMEDGLALFVASLKIILISFLLHRA
ncbi:MAG: hypothetical protein GYA66_07810 [Phyllobacteriaceae bacterium]|nr:hypothetical protein [Phyllobacteriaceae bacterium]